MTFQWLIMRSDSHGTRKINLAASRFHITTIIGFSIWLSLVNLSVSEQCGICLRDFIGKSKAIVLLQHIWRISFAGQKISSWEMLRCWITSILFILGFISTAANCNLQSDRFDRQDRDYRPLQVNSLFNG